MNPASAPCTYFDTPEGRWVLVSEFTTEDAANQFMPHLARDISADDLSSGASGAANAAASPAALSTTNSSTSTGMRFGTASTAMASGGIMFPDAGPQVSSTATNTVTASLSKPYGHTAANRPTHVSIFRSPAFSASAKETPANYSSQLNPNGAAAPGVNSSNGANSAGGSEAGLQPASKGHGFRQGLLHFGKGAGSHSSSTANLSSAQSTHSKGIVTKSTSAYVNRIVTNENLARWIMSDSTQATYFLFNAPRCMTWIGLQPESSGETLARFDLVANTPLCHDINQTTRGENRLDVVMGFVQGNIIWYEPLSGKYSRLNKNSGYSPAIICIKWIPNSDNLFMVGTSDGGVMIMDRTKDDFSVPVLAHSNKPVDSMDAFGVARSQKPKCNPVAYWKVSNKPITSLSFSPDCQRVAVTCEDGGLRIIDYINEILEDVFLSYFGGLSCSAWSDDGKYVITGGKDDLVTIWSYYDQTIVARCEGHESWVRSIAFDPMGHEDESTYRFMSVGEDARLLVWDFSLAALHRPRAQLHRTASHQPGGGAGHARGASSVSTAAAAAHPGSNPGSGSTALHLPGQPTINDAPSEVIHSRLPRDSVAVLQPLMSEAIHDAAICSLQFSDDLLVTASRKGIVKVWKRPAAFDLSSFI
ncbi:WD40 repeat-like protein [Martensiomyces pterosporus]|nr:WD40 repeat-like protein [Martensiomyces pterosporus]